LAAALRASRGRRSRPFRSSRWALRRGASTWSSRVSSRRPSWSAVRST